MFTVRKSLVSDELVTLTDFRDLQDPSKVRYWGEDGVATVKDILTVSESLFTTENIRNNPSIFSNRSYDHSFPQFNEAFLANVPEELYKYAAFYCLNSDSYYTAGCYDIRNIPSWSWESQDGALWTNSAGGIGCQLEDPHYWAGVKLYLMQVKDFFTGAVFQEIKDKKLNTNCYHASGKFYHAYRQMMGERYIRRTTAIGAQSSAKVRAADAGEMLDESAEASIIFSNGDMYCVCPIGANSRSMLYQVFPNTTDVTTLIGAGSAKPTIVKYADGKPILHTYQRDLRLYGVELELTTQNSPREMVDMQGKDVFFVLKQDGSIKGSKANAYECVTKPLSLPDQRRLWTRFFNNIDDLTKFDLSTDTNNGFHVHVSKELFCSDHLKNFAWFLTQPAHTEFMVHLSQRTVEHFAKWSQLPDYSSYPNEKKAWSNAQTLCAAIRGACNIGSYSKKTVEVRIFRGVVSCAEIVRNIEFVDAVYEFTGVRDGQSYRHLTLENFYKWLLSTPRTQYKLLKADLYKLDMPALIRKSKITRLLFGTKDPEVMVSRINTEHQRTTDSKDPFKIDQTVINTMIRIVGKMVFDLDDTGKVVLTHKAVGRISHLDSRLRTAYGKAGA